MVSAHYAGEVEVIKGEDREARRRRQDAANNANEVTTFNYPAMQALGLSASYPLKAVLLTHGHGDHDGGATWLKTNLGAEIFLGPCNTDIIIFFCIRNDRPGCGKWLFSRIEESGIHIYPDMIFFF